MREAAIMLVFARLASRYIRPARVLGWANRPPRRVSRFANDEARWVAWAIAQTGARTKSPSLPLALAAHAMLRRRGVVSRLCLGVARADGAIEARAWIESGGALVVGDAAGFTPLAPFGPT